jgi:hypothetical protein
MSLSLRYGRQVLRICYPKNLSASLCIDGTHHPVVDLSSEGVRVALSPALGHLHPGLGLWAALQLLNADDASHHRLEVLRAAPTGLALRFVSSGVSFGVLLDECRRVLTWEGL